MLRFWILLFGITCSLDVTAASTRHLFLVSDLHVGAGRGVDGKWKRIEDFRWQKEFDQFLRFAAEKSGNNSDLVFVGDVFELWQSPTMNCSDNASTPGCAISDCMESSSDYGCTENEALARLSYVLGQHQDFVDSLRAFASAGKNRVFLIPGNHDAALLFPELTKRLSQVFDKTNFRVETAGHWLSEDGAIYVDHGHQFDDLNRMKNWPKPFATSKNGEERMQKPWGENMVQQFYNQYEHMFPVIDNISDEKSGISFATNDAGFVKSATAVGKFFRFFLLNQSSSQANSFLRTNAAPGTTKWNEGLVKAKGITFFVDVFKSDPKLDSDVQAALASKEIELDVRSLTPDDVQRICDHKLSLRKSNPDVELCPMQDGNLSAVVTGLTSSPESQLVKYLRDVLPRVIQRDAVLPSIYVYGHTHSAIASTKLNLGDMAGGPAAISYVNTGAFQRIVSPEQLKKLLASRTGQVSKSLRDLDVEDLPACYTFISVEPYSGAPVAVLNSWVETSSGKFGARKGGCW